MKEGAIRKRIERGTLTSEKSDASGRVYVYIDAPPVNDTGYDEGYVGLIKSQQEQIEFLRRELERKDAILLNMTETMKAITGPADTLSEPRESPMSSAVDDDKGEVVPPDGAKRRSWWQRVFGG